MEVLPNSAQLNGGRVGPDENDMARLRSNVGVFSRDYHGLLKMCRVSSATFRADLFAGAPHGWDDSRRLEWVVCAWKSAGGGAFAALGPEDHAGDELKRENQRVLIAYESRPRS